MNRYTVRGLHPDTGLPFWALFSVKDGVIQDDVRVLLFFWGWPVRKAWDEMKARGWTVERVDG